MPFVNWKDGKLIRKKKPGKLTPEDLMVEVRDLCEVSDVKAKEIVYAILMTLIRELRKPGARIILPRIGYFETRYYKPNSWETRDPQGRGRIQVNLPGRWKVCFTPYKRLYRSIEDDSVTAV